jgi:hypothetical protein
MGSQAHDDVGAPGPVQGADLGLAPRAEPGLGGTSVPAPTLGRRSAAASSRSRAPWCRRLRRGRRRQGRRGGRSTAAPSRGADREYWPPDRQLRGVNTIASSRTSTPPGAGVIRMFPVPGMYCRNWTAAGSRPRAELPPTKIELGRGASPGRKRTASPERRIGMGAQGGVGEGGEGEAGRGWCRVATGRTRSRSGAGAEMAAQGGGACGAGARQQHAASASRTQREGDDPRRPPGGARDPRGRGGRGGLDPAAERMTRAEHARHGVRPAFPSTRSAMRTRHAAYRGAASGSPAPPRVGEPLAEKVRVSAKPRGRAGSAAAHEQRGRADRPEVLPRGMAASWRRTAASSSSVRAGPNPLRNRHDGERNPIVAGAPIASGRPSEPRIGRHLERSPQVTGGTARPRASSPIAAPAIRQAPRPAGKERAGRGRPGSPRRWQPRSTNAHARKPARRAAHPRRDAGDGEAGPAVSRASGSRPRASPPQDADRAQRRRRDGKRRGQDRRRQARLTNARRVASLSPVEDATSAVARAPRR